jgi:hypothetical protein
MNSTHSVATGLRSLPETNKAFAATQAAWRFFANERISLPALNQPILDYAREMSSSRLNRYALVIHDFSGIDFTRHESKEDRITLYRKQDSGYFLQSALLVSDLTGNPIAPLYLGLEAADGVHSTRRERRLPRRRQIDELNRTFGYVESLELGKACVHIVDRQADSLLHLRRFSRCGRLFVIRSDDIRRVKFEGQSLLLEQVEQRMEKNYRYVGEVKYQGKAARQYVAETSLVLKRLGRTWRKTPDEPKKRQWIKGKPIELRYVLSQVRDHHGKVLATWRLWTNVEELVKAEEIALWYYWRWRIESYFKLLKRGGQNLEQWQQESAEAVAKRLLIVAQVCVIVWALAESKEPPAKQIREFLVRLSGRLMKRKVEFTTSAMLAGMWQFLTMIDVLERHTTAELEEIANEFLKIIGSETKFKDV